LYAISPVDHIPAMIVALSGCNRFAIPPVFPELHTSSTTSL
jgi:hypothetical protein